VTINLFFPSKLEPKNDNLEGLVKSVYNEKGSNFEKSPRIGFISRLTITNSTTKTTKGHPFFVTFFMKCF
jgi:hypothetical protein